MNTDRQERTLRALAVSDRILAIVKDVQETDPDGIKIARAGVFMSLALTLLGEFQEHITGSEILDYASRLADACKPVTLEIKGRK